MIEIISAKEYPEDEENGNPASVTVEAKVDGVHCFIGGFDPIWTINQIKQDIEDRKNEILEDMQRVTETKPIDRKDLVDVMTAHSHWARVSGFESTNAKPLEVTRIWEGEERLVRCYVTKQLKDLYQSGNLLVGDFVMVDFIEGDIDKPLAIAKVFKSW